MFHRQQPLHAWMLALVLGVLAAPMVGGMITAPLLSMFVIPAAYLLMRRSRERRVTPETRSL